MSLPILFVLLIAIAIYWFMTQIRPDHQRSAMLRPGLADGLLEKINAERHARGLALLEMDEGLMGVAENKATHQLLTHREDEGWDYPSDYAHLLGRSLLLEALIVGPATVMGERLAQQRELYEDDWVCCGIGVAGSNSTQIAVAVVLCREAWEPAFETAGSRNVLERLVLGD